MSLVVGACLRYLKLSSGTVKTAGKRPGHGWESPAQMDEIVTGET